MTDENEDSKASFDNLDLSPAVVKGVKALGYETPSPIQAAIIPHVLEGRDVIGQAQTGTGKTAAFALPLLSNLDAKQKHPQVLVLAPTRELAIQVSEAFKSYASQLKGFHVLPIYGGQDYRAQLKSLQRNPQVIVGTPGRVMDHMRRKTLNLSQLKCLVLDEADEMLRMGFIDDVKWVLEQIPKQRQIALFSATMPNIIRKIAEEHLTDPEHITMKVKTMTADTIDQRVWIVSGVHKLDALTRILEADDFDGIIIFVRTKNATLELTDKLLARGYNAAALNGDIQQNHREKTITQLKTGKIDILVATDVAARGLDVDRISHVINYDVPYDTEAYIHRIGRTGRAGRTGKAILFIAPRERRMLKNIESATKQKIHNLELPSSDVINNRRIEQFKQRITDTLDIEDLSFFKTLVEQYQKEKDLPALVVGAALARMAQGDAPLLLTHLPEFKSHSRSDNSDRHEGGREGRRSRFKIFVGHTHEVKPGNIVGAIANEAGLDSKDIGAIKIFDDFSYVDLPEGMPNEVFKKLQGAWVCGQKLGIEKADSDKAPAGRSRPKVGSESEGRRSPRRSQDNDKPKIRRKPKSSPAKSKSKKSNRKDKPKRESS
ncbi:MAG: DEAD/DEAH box helicase [Gammaproteobacteria bacterium]|nr:DEAD/DEAH box helicase [Gammaproteobacteria bacterium]